MSAEDNLVDQIRQGISLVGASVVDLDLRDRDLPRHTSDELQQPLA